MNAKFTSDTLPNCHIFFDNLGMVMVVTLNITKPMTKYLNHRNVFKAEKHFVYAMKKRVQNPTEENVKNTYNHIMKCLKINCRLAKVNVLNEQIINLNS